MIGVGNILSKQLIDQFCLFIGGFVVDESVQLFRGGQDANDIQVDSTYECSFRRKSR